MGKPETLSSSPGHGLTIGSVIAAVVIDGLIMMASGTTSLLRFGAIPLLGAAAAWESTSLLAKENPQRRPARNRTVARTITRWEQAKEANGTPGTGASTPSTSWNMDVVTICGILAVLVVLGLVILA